MNSYAIKYMITYKRSMETNKILTMFFQTLYLLLSSTISFSLGIGTGSSFVSISLFLLLKNKNTITPIAHQMIPVIKVSFSNSVIIIAYTTMLNTANKIPQGDLYYLFKSGYFFISSIKAKNPII